MKKYEGVGVDAALVEKPGKNHYIVKFGDSPADDPAALVEVEVDTLTYQVTRSHVDIIRKSELRELTGTRYREPTDGSEWVEESVATRLALLKTAEIEINSLNSLPMYALIPDAHPMSETMAMPT